jgi:hypothetical protein
MATPAEQGSLDDLARFLVTGKAGDFVFREGDASRDMYIVQEGELELLKKYAGEERQVTKLEAGDFFGEWSLLEEVPREVSAKGMTDYRLLRIDQTTFHQIVREDPNIAVRMLRRLAQRLSERQAADIRAAEIAMGGFKAAVPRDAKLAAALAVPVKPGVPVLVGGDRQFELTLGREAVVGRADPAKSFTPDVDLTPLDTERTLSRRHARIAWKDEGVFVREESAARNGTFVNGRRLTAGEEVKLQDTDRVRFGLVETVFRLK